MVRKRADDGTYYHHPPYTWAEEMAIYKGMDGPQPTVGTDAEAVGPVAVGLEAEHPEQRADEQPDRCAGRCASGG